MQPYLFDKFTKARRPGLKGEESVGLGMFIIKTIVELHEGKIWFESKENKGTTFFIEIAANE
jgi:two-component system sensor histidine kinase VicK